VQQTCDNGNADNDPHSFNGYGLFKMQIARTTELTAVQAISPLANFTDGVSSAMAAGTNMGSENTSALSTFIAPFLPKASRNPCPPSR
jgi:hypothetical protein